MKIIHTADLHIGSPLTSRLPIDKREERQNELMSNFRRLVEEAYSLGAYTVMISGDLFDENAVSRRAKASFLETVRWASDISFFYLEGNHDEVIVEEAEKPENLFTFGKEWTYYELAEDVVISGRKYSDGSLFDTLTLKKDKKNLVTLIFHVDDNAYRAKMLNEHLEIVILPGFRWMNWDKDDWGNWGGTNANKYTPVNGTLVTTPISFYFDENANVCVRTDGIVMEPGYKDTYFVGDRIDMTTLLIRVCNTIYL